MESTNTKSASLFSSDLGFKLQFPDESHPDRLLCLKSKLTLGSLLLLIVMMPLIDLALLHSGFSKFFLVLSPVAGGAALILLGFPLLTTVITEPLKWGARLSFSLAAVLSFAGGYLSCNGVAPFRMPQLSYFLTGTFILYVMTLLSYFETRYITETAKVIEDFKSKRVAFGFKKIGSDFHPVCYDDLQKGDVLKVNVGEMIPMDGIIIKGTTSVDESNITGEFKPLLKSVGDQVIGSTLNRDSEIVIEVNRNKEDLVLERVIQSINENHGTKLKVYRQSSLYGRVISFVGLVCGVCFVIYHLLFLHLPLNYFLQKLIALLCSFSMVSLASSVMMASNTFLSHLLTKGILVKNSHMIEKIGELTRVFFEKTGTLTKGEFEYAQSFIELGTNQGDWLSTLFSLEAGSSHPLARAIETHPWFHEIPKHQVVDKKSHSGLGIAGRVCPRSQKPYFAAVGNLRFLKRQQMTITRDMKNKIDELEAIGETVLLCGYHRQVRGLISFSDNLRPFVREMLEQIKRRKIESIFITGDSVESLSSLAKDLGITKIYPRCTAEEKISKIIPL